LRPRRILVRLVILSVATVVILVMTLAMPVLALTFAGGAVLGVGGAFIGLRHTKFETTDKGHFYTPNTYIGVGLSLLLVGRMIYRMASLYNATPAAGQPAPFQSPLTLFIIGLTVGYYLAYLTGLFVHTHDKR
jgi:hypothetical protein